MRGATRLVLAAGLVAAPWGAARADWERGKAALAEGDYATAEAEFRAEVGARPDWAGAHYMLGETLRRSRQAEAAVDSLRRAVELDGENVSYRLGLAQGLVSARLFTDAVEALGTLEPSALEDGDRRTRAILLASAELSSGRAGEAVAALEAELPAGADDANLQRLLGHGLVRVDRLEDALDAFERAFAMDASDRPSAREGVGVALDLASRAEEVEARDSLYVRAARLAESLAEVEATSADLELAARCLLAAGEAGPALAWVDKALSVRPDDPELLYLGGWALRCSGRAGEARRRLRSALDHEPGEDLRPRIHSQLARLAEGSFDLEEAAKQHRLAGDADRATHLEEIRSSFRSSLDRLADLRRQIDEVNARVTQLEALGQTDAVAQVRGRVAVLEEEAAAIEANLSEVRRAIRGGSDCR